MYVLSRVLAGLWIPQVTTDASTWGNQTIVLWELHCRSNVWHGK